MKNYLNIIISAAFLEIVFGVMLPSGKMKNFAKSLINIIVVLIILEPLINLLKTYILN